MQNLNQMPIAPTLRELEIGETREIPGNRFATVNTTIDRLKRVEGKRFSYITLPGNILSVTRTA